MNKLLLCVLALGMSSMTFAGNENVFDPPVMGWSSWNTYRVNINEALIKKQADAMVQKGLKDAGYNYVNVDDGFFGWRDEHGTMQTHPERFPNGLKGVADHIHSLGLKAGIYSDAGSNTCGFSALLLSILLWYIDVTKKYQKTWIFAIFGVNPLFCYVLSEILYILADSLPLQEQNMHDIIYAGLSGWLGDNAFTSFVYAFLFVGVVWLVGAYLYKKKIYIKI